MILSRCDMLRGVCRYCLTRSARHGPGGYPTIQQQLAAWDVAELALRVAVLHGANASNGGGGSGGCTVSLAAGGSGVGATSSTGGGGGGAVRGGDGGGGSGKGEP